jgi:hypothetical protein
MVKQTALQLVLFLLIVGLLGSVRNLAAQEEMIFKPHILTEKDFKPGRFSVKYNWRLKDLDFERSRVIVSTTAGESKVIELQRDGGYWVAISEIEFAAEPSRALGRYRLEVQRRGSQVKTIGEYFIYDPRWSGDVNRENSQDSAPGVSGILIPYSGELYTVQAAWIFLSSDSYLRSYRGEYTKVGKGGMITVDSRVFASEPLEKAGGIGVLLLTDGRVISSVYTRPVALEQLAVERSNSAN